MCWDYSQVVHHRNHSAGRLAKNQSTKKRIFHLQVGKAKVFQTALVLLKTVGGFFKMFYMKQYFLIMFADKSEIEREAILHCERANLPQWTSCSPGFTTKEELYKYAHIPEWKCSKCGGFVPLTYQNNKQLIEHKMCFNCNHFRKQFEAMKTNKNKYIVNGGFYTVYPDDPQAVFKGFGGRLFHIKEIATGKVIDSRNVWHQGQIPKAWEFENTAEFM